MPKSFTTFFYLRDKSFTQLHALYLLKLPETGFFEVQVDPFIKPIAICNPNFDL